VRRASRLGLLAAGLVLAGAAPASADHKHRVDVDRIAKGLDNPRHVAISKSGDVYVAESGRGGGGPATSKSCFDSAEGPSCTGATGAITRIDRWERKRRVVTGLASFAPYAPELPVMPGDNAIGPHGVYVDGDDVYFTNGGPTAPTREGEVVLRDPTLVSEEPVSSKYGKLFRLGRHGGVREIADLWDFERVNNPDAEVGNPLIDSNPVDVYADDGRFYVADAGGNTVLRVGRFGGISALAVFGDFPNPTTIGPPTVQAVPTGVVKGPDGALYMSQLTGFPFLKGAAKVFRIDPRTGAVTEYASGFTNAIDLAFGRDGTLYVLEIDADGLFPVTGPGTDGGLWTVPRRGAPKRVALPAGTLTQPGGIAVGRRGDLYITNHSAEAGDGEVLKIDLR